MNLGVLCPIHRTGSNIVDLEHRVLLREIEEGGLGLAFDAPEKGGHEGGGLGRAFAGDVDEREGCGGLDGGEGAGEGEGVVVCYLDVLSAVAVSFSYT